MGGGLIQLVAYGSQDMYLTGNPQITFFKSVYRRHTNFAIESMKKVFNGAPNFGQDISATLDKSGDLIHKMYLQIDIPEVELTAATSGESGEYVAFRWLNWLGHILVEHVELTIGGQQIDIHYGDWLHVWNELTQTAEQGSAYAEMVGNVPKLTQIHSCNTNTSTSTEAYTLYIPLQFWFNRHPGLALPIISLQHTDVVLNVKFRNLDHCIWATKQDNSVTNSYNSSVGHEIFSNNTNRTRPQLGNVFLYTDYIFLDTAERRRFSQVQHEYLIEQVQRKTASIAKDETKSIIKFKFNHPVKEIIWTVQPKVHRERGYGQPRGGRQYFNYSDSWDYSGFTGTPSGYYGPGLKGGKNSSDLIWSVPTVKTSGTLTSSNGWNKYTTSTSSNENIGYADVQAYTKTSSTNLYSERTYEQFFGPVLAQPENENSVGLVNATGNGLLLADGGKNPVDTAKIILNGNERFNKRNGFYFNTVQPYQHHTGSPAVGINVYSFAIKPEDYQPSGTCNFSRLDNTELDLELTANSTSKENGAEVHIYGVNYNVLRIMSGMAGLAYSN